MNRGDRREPIVRDDRDRHRFVETLGETCRKTQWEVLAVCLMPNHFHLVVETPKPNLVAGMRRRAKGDAKKVQIAQRLRQESTMSLKWIAACLEMGTWTHLSNRLAQQRQPACVNTKD